MRRPDRNEFDRQVGNLIQAGYPAIRRAGRRGVQGAACASKGARPAAAYAREIEARQGMYLYIIVVRSDGLSGDKAMEKVERQGKRGFSIMDAEELRRFQPIEGVELPPASRMWRPISTGDGDAERDAE